MGTIAENTARVFAQIDAAARRCGRDPREILLVAATKTVDPERINEAIAAGVRCVGENKVQEFTEKYDLVSPEAARHFIGHLQTNKVKYIVGKAQLIHSADSAHLLDEIERVSKNRGLCSDVLVEVNAAEEDTKFGISLDEVEAILEGNEKREHVKIRGIMTIGPNHAGPEEIRQVFRKTYQKFLDIRQKKYDNSSMEYLSMGMSADFEIAIEEGANIIRVGSAIFGRRNY